ncbi:MAG: beta-lactamase family protein [Actinobacteria bacterium]|nr:beta-lactamase family protein [Actinomycetota bacterium]
MGRTDLEPDADLEELLAAECARLAVPGAAVGVVHGDRSLAASFGVTNVNHPLPVDSDTLFMIGSTTKTFTATTMMALVSDGVVSLDDPLVKHLPELELQDATARDTVTVGQLFDHTAGWRGDVEVDTGWGDDALARALPEYAAKVPQVFAPGTMTSYNNLSLIIAGRLIEKLTGRGYEAVVKDRLLEPLGMTDTFMLPWEVITRKVATGHVVRDGTATPAYVWPTSRAIGPAGGATSTVRDQLTYARFHLGGVAAGTAPVQDELRLSMQQPRVSLPSALSGVGVSWLLKDRDGLRLVSHGGNCSNLFLSSFDLAPDEGFGVTVLTNSRGGGALGSSVLEWAVQHYLDRSPVPTGERLPLTPALSAEYVGRYDAGQWDLEVTAGVSRPAGPVGATPDVIAPAGSPSNSSGDFIRDDDGNVAWLRQGLRVARRQP